VERGPLHLWAPGRDLVDQDPIDTFQAKVEKQKFQEIGVQEEMMEVERRL